MKQVIFLSLLVLITLSQRTIESTSPNAYHKVGGGEDRQRNIDNLQKQTVRDTLPKPMVDSDHQHKKNYDELSEEEKAIIQILIITGIVCSAILFGLSTCLLIKCMKKRNKRKQVQDYMRMKQVNTAATMGMTIHEMMTQADRPKTIHI